MDSQDAAKEKSGAIVVDLAWAFWPARLTFLIIQQQDWFLSCCTDSQNPRQERQLRVCLVPNFPLILQPRVSQANGGGVIRPTIFQGAIRRRDGKEKVT